MKAVVGVNGVVHSLNPMARRWPASAARKLQPQLEPAPAALRPVPSMQRSSTLRSLSPKTWTR